MKYGREAFTIVELLVVIAILAVLAAVVYPVFASAREKGRRTSCLNNLRQISLVLQQYLQEYDGHYPGATYFYGSGDYFSEKGDLGFPSKVKGRQILWCPSGVQPKSGSVSVSIDSSILFTNYLYNTELVNDPSGRGNIGREESAAPADSLVLVFDGSDEPGQGKSIDMSSCPAQVGLPLYPTLHHEGGNYLFADGHGLWMLPETAVAIQCKAANALRIPGK